MRKIFNFKIQHLLATTLLMTGLSLAFSACSEDDNSSNAPAVKKTASTFNSASFEWAAVNGASEYNYRLVCDNDKKEVTKATTSDTKVTFNNLASTKTYYLYVAAIVGGTPTEEGRAAAATGFQIVQPSASIKIRMTEGKGVVRKLKTTLSWSATAAEKFGYSIDGGNEVITEKTTLELPDNFSVTEHTLAIRSISSNSLFNNSATKIYTFTPTGSMYNGNLGSKTLGIEADPITLQSWRLVDDTKFEDLLKYRMDFANVLKQTFSCYPEFKKDDKSYTLIPLGSGITVVKDNKDKVIGYDFGTIDGKPICVTSMSIDSGFTTVTITYAYDADMKQKETIKIPITAKKKNADKNEL